MTHRLVTHSALFAPFAAALACGLIQSGAAFADNGNAARIKRGAFLVAAGDCVTCHTPFRMGASGPEKDMARGLSGHPESLRLAPPPRAANFRNERRDLTLSVAPSRD